MFRTKDNFSGAQFNYESGTCKANGEFRFLNSTLNSVNINGEYVKSDHTYTFWANRDANGNLNLNGVPVEVIIEVAQEVAIIIEKIEAINGKSE